MIYVNEGNLEFHLQSKQSSYIFKVLNNGHLSHLYYGKRLRHNDDFSQMARSYTVGLGNGVAYSQEDKTFSMNDYLAEYPTYGKGDYREPAILAQISNGANLVDFKYQGYSIYEGKYLIDGLPHFYSNDNTECETLEITLYDEVNDLTIKLYYGLFKELDIITRAVKVINGNKYDLKLNKLMSLNIDFNTSDFELITLDGAWIRERHINRRPINQGVTYIDSKKGVSGSDHSPFICLTNPNTNENSGECYGFGLVYSGNHRALVEVNPFFKTRVQMGINPFGFTWNLGLNETFMTPEVVMTYSDKGLNEMSNHFHKAIRHNLVRGEWKYKDRPILINNWEATYFDFNEKKLLDLAKEASNLGIELFVLDDGWFGKRDNDLCALGDWFVNTKKLPSGLDGLSKKINDLGLDFGLWVEPEMISYDSDLYRAHPEWVIRMPERELSLGRNQAILDFANPEVCEYIYNSLKKVFSSANITYIKWDMNRNFTDIFSNYLKAQQQGELLHRYYLGFYNILERLTSEFPHILFESCSAGGNRFDLGMLYYMPQTWTSDNTDAVERTYIQYGTSLLFPPSTMGAHVSGNVNHQVMRKTPIESRFNVAAMGLLGYELDLTKLCAFDKKVIKKQVEYYKENRHTLQFGDFYRLESPFESNNYIVMSVSENKDEAYLVYVQKMMKPNPGIDNLKLLGLCEDNKYNLVNRIQHIKIKTFGEMINNVTPVKIKEDSFIHNTIDSFYLFEQEKEDIRVYGDELMFAGFKPKPQFTSTGYNEDVRIMTDYDSRMYKLTKINEVE